MRELSAHAVMPISGGGAGGFEEDGADVFRIPHGLPLRAESELPHHNIAQFLAAAASAPTGDTVSHAERRVAHCAESLRPLRADLIAVQKLAPGLRPAIAAGGPGPALFQAALGLWQTGHPACPIVRRARFVKVRRDSFPNPFSLT
jgi:hypothetical protein